jgi:hypothetical protein
MQLQAPTAEYAPCLPQTDLLTNRLTDQSLHILVQLVAHLDASVIQSTGMASPSGKA